MTPISLSLTLPTPTFHLDRIDIHNHINLTPLLSKPVSLLPQSLREGLRCGALLPPPHSTNLPIPLIGEESTAVTDINSTNPDPSTYTHQASNRITKSNQLKGAFYKIPHPVRFFISGTIGNAYLFNLSNLIRLRFLPYLSSILSPTNSDSDGLMSSDSAFGNLNLNSGSIAFVLAYIIQIPLQHLLNAYFLYPSIPLTPYSQYLSSLLATYNVYTLSIVLSTAVKWFLCVKLGVGEGWGFVGSVYGVGILNYFVLNSVNRGNCDGEVEGGGNGKKE